LEAWRKAEAMAVSNPHIEVVYGRGGSMAPLYPDGTVLVVEKKTMEQLQAGMAIAYMNSGGWIVVHMLIRQTASGWIVQGLANNHPDAERVNAQNLIGTVIKAYSTTNTTILADDSKQ
jgi:signal peptidase I